MACDLIFASVHARFAQSETKLGFVTGWGGSHRLVRRVGLARAKELVFSGRLLEAGEAVQIGVADWQGSTEELGRHLDEFLRAVSGNSRVAIREMKRILASCPDAGLEANAASEAAASRRCLSEGDAAARVQDFLRRKSAAKPAAGA
jgi:enoyl-CoA hydratase/carnithine racemase